MRFLVDAQLPPTLARWLGERSHAASAVRELGLRDSDDGSIRNYAAAGGWVLITKDDDFVEHSLGNAASPPIVWLRIGNCTNRALFEFLEPLLPEVARRLEAGHRVIEVRRSKSAGT